MNVRAQNDLRLIVNQLMRKHQLGFTATVLLLQDVQNELMQAGTQAMVARAPRVPVLGPEKLE